MQRGSTKLQGSLAVDVDTSGRAAMGCRILMGSVCSTCAASRCFVQELSFSVLARFLVLAESGLQVGLLRG
jgi:hypothetical protein